MRSINTSLTTVLALFALYFLGPQATEHFALTLIIGVIAGTYSSIFIASALLLTIEMRQKQA
jgi:preprotein translocase subunit SecF